MDDFTKTINVKTLPIFFEAINKLSINDITLTDEHKSFLLSCAILFAKKYDTDKRFKTYAEFAYYIILKYSTLFKDYEPLYDFSINMGFYPISQIITSKQYITFASIPFSLLEMQIENTYRRGEIIQTFEQKKTHDEIINTLSDEICFIAPTSFGKSSIIIDHLKANIDIIKKAAVIVPTKSLLMQTYRSIRDSRLGIKILIHDEMYTGEDNFIAVFTQERALRLMEKQAIAFDALYIDEAHRIFERDARSVLLTRLIRLNRTRNVNAKTIYLSPLIDNSENLKIDKSQKIFEQKIAFNIKEPEFFEYRLDGSVHQYNRFVDSFFSVDYCNDIFQYIKSRKSKKSFCYLYSPRKIEAFSQALSEHCESIASNNSIAEVINNLSNYIHNDFYAIDYLKRGIVYLHGKMPDNVKDYLEYKYTQIPELTFLIANKVVLEGMNLPIDSIFILNTYKLYQKDLTNLIGRVNRLDQIFNPEMPNLRKLLPQVHFVNSEFNRKNSNMQNKIRTLKSNVFNDEIDNPLLHKFDIKRFDKDKDKKDLEKCRKIIKYERILQSESDNPIFKLEQKLISLGINNIYDVNDILCEELNKRFRKFSRQPFINSIHILDKLHTLFIKDLEVYILDQEFVRLRDQSAINYYKMFFERRKKSLKENIALEVLYFQKKAESKDSRIYIGESYGEIPYEREDKKSGKLVFIDLKEKDKHQLVNIAIVKQKIEEDFTSYKLHMFFQLMLDYKLISQDEFNNVVYGTNDKKKIDLVKMGLTVNIINRLDTDKQLQNIEVDQNNNLKGNENFYIYKNGVDDFFRFELSKFL